MAHGTGKQSGGAWG